MAQGGLGTLIPDLIIPRPVQAFSWKLMKLKEKILVNAILGKEVFGEGGDKYKKRRQLEGRRIVAVRDEIGSQKSGRRIFIILCRGYRHSVRIFRYRLPSSAIPSVAALRSSRRCSSSRRRYRYALTSKRIEFRSLFA
jgi:hypothetical protein